jgi:hypothetical protein
MRVRITKMPLDKAAYGKQVDGSLSLQPGAFGGADYTASDKTFYKGVKDTISAVPREEANLEAEGGETAFGPISGQSIPDHVKIRGKRHHEGGVPLNLPDDTFIFSDTASLKINDPSVLAMFNKTPKKGGYTPAEIAKPYNINKYKAILLDPDTSKLERNTATIMIKNYIMKLGALAIVQESMKGFPQGIPAMAKPYMEANGITEEDLIPELKEQADALTQSVEQGANPQMPQEQNPMAAQEMQQMNPEQAMQDQQMMMNQGQGQPAYPQQMPSGAPVAMPQGDMSQMAPEGMMQYGGMNTLRRAEEGGSDDMEVPPELESECYEEASWPGGPRKRKKSCRELIEAWHKRKKRQDKVTRFFMNAGQTALELGLAGGAALGSGYLAPKESGWGKMMRTVGSKIGDFFQEDGGTIGYNDSMRTLRRANEGMEQGGQDQQMMQIMQKVAQALQQGAQPEELTAELLQGQIPPEAIMQIFVELGLPEDQVEQLVMSTMQQMQGGQEPAPMAMYGMSMGGYDFPYDPNQMAYGGVPKFAGPENSQVNNTDPGGPDRKVSKQEWGSKQYDKYTVDPSNSRRKTYENRGNVEGYSDYNKPHANAGSGSGPFKGNLCEDMKTEGRTHYGKTAAQVVKYAFKHHYVLDANGVATDEVLPKWAKVNAAEIAKLQGCEVKGAVTESDAIIYDEEGKKCICLGKDGKAILDKNGAEIPTGTDPTTGECIQDDPKCHEPPEELLCRCVDPNTGEVKEFPIEREEECVCQDGSRGQVSGGDRPHWSVPAQTNVLRNAMMNVNPASSNVVLPGRAQIQGAYEEYQTKVDQGLAANQSLQNAIMTGMAGSTGAKQAQMKDLLGKSLRASMDAVAGVQSRNVDRQRETNTQSAAIDNSNMLTRAQILGQGLEAQKNRKDVRTSNVNKRTFNTMGAVMEADTEMGRRQNMNVTTPQYASEYDYGFITPTGVEKPLTGANGATLEDRIQYYLAKTGDYQKAFEMAYKEARISKKHGGYVMATNVFPFI